MYTKQFKIVVVCLSLITGSSELFSLDSGDVLITHTSGSVVIVDNNKPCPGDPMEGMGAGYVSFEICNVSGTTLSNLSIKLDSFTGAGFGLGGGQDANQFIGSLDDGDCKNYYWYVDWPCTASSMSDMRASVSDGTTDTVSTTSTITVESTISSNATGIVGSHTLGDGIAVGQIFEYDVVYEYGTIGIGDELSFQPAGNEDFDASCIQLINIEILSSDVNSINAGTMDSLFFISAAKTTGSGNEVAVRFYFKALCIGTTTTTKPYAFANSGTQLKYTGNYEEIVADTLAEAINPFNISKFADSTSLDPGDTTLYTIVIRNTSAFHTSIDSIVDILPVPFMFRSILLQSDIDSNNSSFFPSSGSSGTLVFKGGVTADSFPYSEYFIAAGDSISLVYSIDIPVGTAPGNYTNSATIFTGTFSSTPVSSDIGIGINQPPIAATDSVTIPEDTPIVINVLVNDIDPDGDLIGDSIRILTLPTHGDTSAVGDSVVTYSPHLNFNGLDSFQYEVCDTSMMGSQCDTAWVFITITPVNDPPIVTEVPQITPEDTPVTFCPALSDPDTGDTLTMSICGPPQNGTGSLVQMDTCIEYSPTMNYSGPDTICVKVCDLAGLCDSIYIPITVTPFSDPPIATNDTITTTEDTPIVINVLVNDIDPDGDLIGDSIRILTLSAHGDTSVVGDSVVTYTPDVNFNGLDSFQYEVCDTSMMGSQCDTAWVFITITPVNDPPIVTEVPQITPEDTPVTFCPALSDPDTGDILTMSICGGPQNGLGSLIQMDTCIEYTPTMNYSGPDTICVKVCDLAGLCDSIYIPITVTPLSDPPIATNDTTITAEDTPIVINVLVNDIDPDGDLIGDSIRILTLPTHGDTSAVGDSVVTYTPDLNFNGLDSFQYEVCDTSMMGSQCDTAWVLITITPVNDPPVVTEVPQTTPEDTPVTFCPTLSDPDTGDTLTMSICGGPQNGSGMLVQMDTCIEYTPTMNYFGPDTICVKVCDQGGLCDSIYIPITVIPFSDPPIAINDTITTTEDTPIVINVLTNDIDPDGDLMGDSIRILMLPSHGDTSAVGDSVLTYTPDLNFNGLDSFQYEVCDTSMMGSQCDTAWVFITITPVNDPPVVTELPQTTPEDTPVTFCPALSDPDTGDTLTMSICGGPQNGTGSLVQMDTCIEYSPTMNYSGSDTICVKVCDQGGLCDSIYIPITVTTI